MKRKKRVFVVDAYDSFVYMLYQHLGEMGCELMVARSDAVDFKKVQELSPDYVLLSPGPGRPEESGFFPVIEKLQRTPMLGVCLGMQAMAAHFGGKVSRAKHIMHGKVSEIEHDGKGIFKGVKNPFIATRYHSLIVEEVPACFEVTARSREDGYAMAMRHRKLPMVGVQFHPESVLTRHGKRILKNFLETYKR